MVESSRKWPESGLVVQIPCSPVTLCRDLRTEVGPILDSSIVENQLIEK